MKRLLAIFFALPLLFVACEQPKESEVEVKPPVLTLTSESMLSFSDEGGVGIIEYALENEVEGAEFTAEKDAEWISDFSFGENIAFRVLPNDGAEREATITIKYDVASMEITVKQEAVFEGYKLSYGIGTYYLPGAIEEAPEVHNYYVTLATVSDFSTYLPDNSYLELDFYATTGDAENPSIPVGEYTLDLSNSCAPGTVGCAYSRFMYFNADYFPEVWILPVDGKVVVTDKHIEGYLVDEYGDKVTFRFKGDIALDVESEIPEY